MIDYFTQPHLVIIYFITNTVKIIALVNMHNKLDLIMHELKQLVIYLSFDDKSIQTIMTAKTLVVQLPNLVPIHA